jgi:hypothetical protein
MSIGPRRRTVDEEEARQIEARLTSLQKRERASRQETKPYQLTPLRIAEGVFMGLWLWILSMIPVYLFLRALTSTRW